MKCPYSIGMDKGMEGAQLDITPEQWLLDLSKRGLR